MGPYSQTNPRLCSRKGSACSTEYPGSLLLAFDQTTKATQQTDRHTIPVVTDGLTSRGVGWLAPRANMSSSRDVHRLRMGLQPLTTASLGGAGAGAGAFNPHQLNTPISAISMSSSHLPSAAQTPGSAIQPYNPQEWAASPAPNMDSQHHYTADTHGNHSTAYL